MSRRWRQLLLAFIIALVAIGGCNQVVNASTYNTQACSDDSGCWNCETMGNQVCGLVAVQYIRGLDGRFYTQVVDSHLRIVSDTDGEPYYVVGLDGSLWVQVWREGWLLFEGLTSPGPRR